MCLLSICVPTYNRQKNLKELLDSIESNSSIEVVICDDGSTDKTSELVKKYSDKLKIKYIYQQNLGVSAAMLKAYNHASGKYVIKMDSDDIFEDNGINFILESISNNTEQVAFLYGVKALKNNKQFKNLPPNGIFNFTSVRADCKIKGDLKEVVSREIVLNYMYKVPEEVRRIPPSLLWVKIAEDYDCLSFNSVVAIKKYLDGGITSQILSLNVTYPAAIVELYKILAYSKVYKSLIYRWRSRLLWARYSFHNRSMEIKKWWQFIVFIPGILIYMLDRIFIYKNSR